MARQTESDVSLSNINRIKKEPPSVLRKPIEEQPCSRTASPNIGQRPKGLCSQHLLGCCVVQFDYVARTGKELSVKKGERLEILHKEIDWWFAQKLCRSSKSDKNQKENEQGFVPVQILAREESLEAEPWYCGEMTRFEAENQLLSPNRNHGSFLVRKSERIQNSYVLSANVERTVIHSLISHNEAGRFYLHSGSEFDSVHELVEFYKNNMLFRGVKLMKPSTKKEPVFRHLSYNTVDEWERPKAEFTLVRCIGSGSYGDVWKAIWNDSVHVAIKMLRADATDPNKFLKEAQIMKNLQHPNLIRLYAVCTRKQPFFIVTELMRHGDLLKYLKRYHLQIPQMIDMAAQAAAGMSHLESNNYIHLDLAARNILVGDNNVCKIADFGLARLIKEDNIAIRFTDKLPIKWTAPEVVMNSDFSVKSDVWSFGIVLYEIITKGKMPYLGMTNRDALFKVANGYRMPCPAGCPEPIYNLMRECWNENPDDRPSFKTLKLQLEDFLTINFSTYTLPFSEVNKTLNETTTKT
uniref:Tyrosine-protein kinase n=1 Tax=Callorhinchus milii TaxID=7868 RepID=A0A4W3HB74_CALMI